MAEFQHIFEGRVKAIDDQIQAFRGIMHAGWHLKQHTTQFLRQAFLDRAIKIADQLFGTVKLFVMRNSAGRLNSELKALRTSLMPALQKTELRKPVKGDIQLK